MAEAEAQIETIPVAEAAKLLGSPGVVFVDLRDPRELDKEGRIPGAVHCPRGMLEFWIDPESPYARPVFQQEAKFVFFCGAAGARRWPQRPRRTWACRGRPYRRRLRRLEAGRRPNRSTQRKIGPSRLAIGARGGSIRRAAHAAIHL